LCGGDLLTKLAKYFGTLRVRVLRVRVLRVRVLRVELRVRFRFEGEG
jgi:hypothetical protein